MARRRAQVPGAVQRVRVAGRMARVSADAYLGDATAAGGRGDPAFFAVVLTRLEWASWRTAVRARDPVVAPDGRGGLDHRPASARGARESTRRTAATGCGS